MSRFKGADCPVCKAVIGENDDIVVCPDCGTPHHRSCWAVKSVCENHALHGGFLWKSPIDNAIHGYMAMEEHEILELEQSMCEGEEVNETNISNSSGFKDFMENIGLTREYYESRREKFENRDIYGVSEREIICFQGNVNPFSAEKYRRIASGGKIGNKVSLNLLAILFFPCTAFYSRMRAVGIVMVLTDFILNLPYTILFLFDNQKLFTLPMLSETDRDFLIQINILFGAAHLLYRIMSFLFYDYVYLRWMTYKIKNIRTRYISPSAITAGNTVKTSSDGCLGESYYSALKAAGKPSFLKLLLDSLGCICFLTSVTLLVIYFLN